MEEAVSSGRPGWRWIKAEDKDIYISSNIGRCYPTTKRQASFSCLLYKVLFKCQVDLRSKEWCVMGLRVKMKRSLMLRMGVDRMREIVPIMVGKSGRVDYK